MMAFRIRFDRWKERPERSLSEGPIFHVYTGTVERPLWIHVLLASSDVSHLQHAMGVQGQGREPHPQLKRAVFRYAVQRIEQGLREELFPAPPTDHTYDLLLEEADLLPLQQLLQGKTCAYQRQEGRELLCAAAHKDDADLLGRIGLWPVAWTSRPLCNACNLPDTDYLCSHLLHPLVRTASPGVRRTVSAHCNLNRTEIGDRSQCCAGGHSCWERMVEWVPKLPAIPFSSLTLPEVFDFLDTCWRLAFGKNKALLRLKNMTETAMLSLPCATRDEFSTRVSALADVLNGPDHGTGHLGPLRSTPRLAVVD